MVDLVVNPPERKADVIDLSTRPAWTPPAPIPVGEPGNVSSIVFPGDPIVALTQTVTFPNTTAYKTYRVLITRTRGDSVDGVQYSEVKLGKLSVQPIM